MLNPKHRVTGSTVTGRARPNAGQTGRLDQNHNLELIASAVDGRYARNEAQLIGIQGAFGSGKTQLASALVEAGVNVDFINVLQHHRSAGSRCYDIAPLLTDTDRTYVIDEAGYAYQPSLTRAVTELVDRGAIVVLLFQRFRELDPSLVNTMVQFDLLGGSLIERPAGLRAVARRTPAPVQ